MSQLVDFFVSGGKDINGRTLAEMIAYGDEEFEGCHDFIQWMFPLHEPSRHSLHSPVLTAEDIAILKASEKAGTNILLALDRFKSFLGIKPIHKVKQRFWAHEGNHNLLRITRVIRSLRLFGKEQEAKEFYTQVVAIGKHNGVGENSMDYWDNAMYDPVDLSMTARFLNEREIRL